jgi:hypothetical protein
MRGGTRPNAGRKPKDQEQKLIERLDNIINSDDVLLSLKELIEEKNLNAIKLYLEYRFGKPKDEVTAIIQKDDFNIKDLIRFTD